MRNGLKSWLVIVVLFMMAMLGSGCTSATAGLNSVPTIQSAEYRLVPGDKIRVTIPDLQKTDTEYLIDQSGVISLPLVKDIKIVGLTLREAEAAVEKILIDRNLLVRPTVSIQALSLRPVYILGEVGRPGEYIFKEGLTVFFSCIAGRRLHLSSRYSVSDHNTDS